MKRSTTSSRSRRSFLAGSLAAVNTMAGAATSEEKELTAKFSKTEADLRSVISRADLVYDRPVARSEEGIPLGNGRMGTLVWTTPTQIRLQINRVDVYANNCQTNSFFERHNDYCSGCAYVEIDFGCEQKEIFTPPDFRQELAVYDGTITVSGRRTSIQMLAVPSIDVIAAQVHTTTVPFVVRLRMLRHSSQYFGAALEDFAREHTVAVETRSHLAKCQLLVKGHYIVLTQEFWEDNYYNKSAIAIGIVGKDAKAAISNETEIRLVAAANDHSSTVLIGSAASFDPGFDVVEAALQQLETASRKSFALLKSETNEWWHRFWSRGSLQLKSPDGTAEFIEVHYHYFLYLMAATSRGKLPPKFNGMLWNTGGDLRTWGAQHWFANSSCYYEALFTANRLELLDPLFDMYSGMYNACAVAARQQWGSQGIFIPETVYFDGLEKLPDEVAQEMQELYLMRKPWSERSEKFRTYSETKHPHSSRWNWIASGKWEKGRWIMTERGSGPFGNVSHIFGTTGKIAYLFWRRFEFTQDREWLRSRAYPMLRGAAEFYRHHPNVTKEQDGSYHIRYVNSNESVWGARDTDEDLAAMRGVFAALLRASELLGVDGDMRPGWKEFSENLPALPDTSQTDALRPPDYQGPKIFARGHHPAVKSSPGVLPDQNSLPHWFFDLCNSGSPDAETLALAHKTFDAYFGKKIDGQTPIGVLSKLPIAGATLGRSEAVRFLIANQIRALRPERSTAYRNGGVLPNRMTLREGPQALDAQRLGRGAEALQIALLQSAPPAPGHDPVIRVCTAWPKDWSARFQLLARGGFTVECSFENGMVQHLQIRSLAGVECRIENPWAETRVTLVRNGTRAESLKGSLLKFPTAKDDRIALVRG